MSAAEAWLRGALERALSVGDPARYPELVGAVEALAATGALPAEVAQEARDRLDEAFAPGAERSDPFGRPVAPPRGPAEELVAVLAPVAPLTDVDGSEIVVLAVELWTNVVIVRVGSTGGRQRPDGPSGEATVTWGVGRPELPDGVPYAPLPAPALLQLPLRLADDVGTLYVTARGTTSGDPPLRAERVFTPGAPAAAHRLLVSVPATAGRPGATVEVELPERS